MIDVNIPFKFWCHADHERVDYSWNPDTEMISWVYEGQPDDLHMKKEVLFDHIQDTNWCVIIEENE